MIKIHYNVDDDDDADDNNNIPSSLGGSSDRFFLVGSLTYFFVPTICPQLVTEAAVYAI